MVFSHTRLSAKKGKSNLYTPSTTSCPFTGVFTLLEVLSEQSMIQNEVITVINAPMPSPIFTSLVNLIDIDFSLESPTNLNKIHEAIKINQNKPCSSN